MSQISNEELSKLRLYLDAGLQTNKIMRLLEPSDNDTNKRLEIMEIIENHKASKSPSKAIAKMAYELMTKELEAKFIIYADDTGTAVPLKRLENTNTVKESSREELYRVAAKVLWSNECPIGKRKITELVETWLLTCECTSNFPKAFSLNRDVIAFNHLLLEISQEPTPVFDDFIGRCGLNGPALMAYIWSIFVEADSTQQYVLLRGEGKDGKGSLMRLIEKLIGPRAYQGMSTRDPHWVARLVGKRVVFWGDVNSTAFVLSSEFKTVTGGDKVTITEKYKPSYSAYLYVKIFISTNNDAEITSRKSDLRRCIYVDVKENPNIVESYETKLWQERAGILFKCREAYQKLFNAAENVIDCKYNELMDSTEEFEIKFGSIVERYFELGANLKESSAKVYSEIIPYFKMTQEYSQFVRWLERKHGVLRSSEVITGKKRNILKGIQLKSICK